MPSFELYFKNKDALLDYNKLHRPEWYSDYLALREKIKKANFPGAVKLLKRANNKQTADFLGYLTEINLANVLLAMSAKPLHYEASEGIDFRFENMDISVKNLNAKDYEKSDHELIQAMQAQGGGKTTRKVKLFSEADIRVEKTEFGTYMWERTETGNSGFLGSDIYHMSSLLKYVGELEQTKASVGTQKILFLMNYSEELKYYHMDDAAFWYYGRWPKNYPPIFRAGPSWYNKLLGKHAKNNTVDAIVFMCCPENILVWPDGCFKDTIHERSRLSIYTINQTLREQLEKIF